MKKIRSQSGQARMRFWLAGLAVAVFLGSGISSTRAFTTNDANTAIDAFLAQFYSPIGSGGAVFLNQQNTGGATYFWGQAEEIEGMLDAYERTGNPIHKADVIALVNGFSSSNGTNWCATDSYNDDVCWACIAYLRAYQDTGTTLFRSIAQFNFNNMFARAWDTNFLGGGLWWDTADQCKNACINGPATIVACLLFQTLTNAAYLTQAQKIYNWEKTNLFNTSSGAIYDNINTNPADSSTWSSTYNQGTFIGAATFLGDTASAMLAMNYTMNDMGQPNASGYNILPEYDDGTGGNNAGFNSIGLRWMCRFMITNGLQSVYLPWLQANANAAVNLRRTSDNLSWCQWEHMTPADTDLYSWDCLCSMDALQVVPPGGDSVTNYFRIVNQYSGLCLDLAGAAATNGAPICQWTINTNLLEQEWALLPTENQNAFKLISKVTGLCAGISGNSTNAGAALCDSAYTGNNPGQQFTLTYVSNGCFNLVNVNSGLVLTDAGEGATNNTAVTQTGNNPGTAGSPASQLWALQPVGQYYIRADSDYYVCVSGGSSANGADIITYSWQPNPWFQWHFVNETNGWYGCYTLNAPASVVNIAADSVKPGALLQLQAYVAANNGYQKLTVFPQYDGTVKFYFQSDNQTWDITNNYNNNAQLVQNTNSSAVWQTFTMEALPSLPAVPTGLQAMGGYGLAGLNWTAAALATNYLVARATSSGAETYLASTTTTNYTDTTVTNGVTYYYVVTAQNSLGQTGASGEAQATPQAPVPGTYEAALAADHPLAYWPLAETTGTAAFDPVGGHFGTYVGGVTLAQPGVPLAGFGSPSYGALFNGNSAYVNIPGGSFNIKTAITTIAWVNVPATPSHFSDILGHGDSSWRMSVNTGGQPGGVDGGSGDATGAASIAGSGWHMVAYAYTGVSGAANNGALYVDGALVANDTVSSPAGNATNVWIGGAPDYGTARLLPGWIAHAAIFTQALSAAQVLALYNAAAKPAIPTGLQAWSGYGLVSLKWMATTGAVSYNVKRSTSSGAETTLASATTTNYTDTAVTNGTTYYYVITAQNSSSASAASGEVQATPQAPVPGTYAAAVAGAQPLAYWPLDETAGPVAFDPVGGHNGAYVGGVALAQPGMPLGGFAAPSYAASFNGTSAYVDIPGGPFNLTNALTTIAWVNVPAATNAAGIIGHGDGSWRLILNASGDPVGADGGSAATNPASLAGSGWHMVGYVYTGVPGVTNNGLLYVDGARAANNTVSAPAGSSYDVWIGGAPDYGTNRLLAGRIAQAAVFPQALSAAQMLALYDAASTPAIPTGLQAWSGYGLVSLSWAAATGATSYNVARSTISGAETMLTSTTSTNYTDASLANGTTYYYVVTAKNSSGQSGASGEVQATPQAPETGSYEAAVVNDQPLAYWPLDETTGPVAFDPVGGHNGTYVGGVALGQPGVPLAGFAEPGYSALFDGLSACVDIPEGPFNLTGAFTTIAWVNLPANPAHFSDIIGRGDSSWRLSVTTSGTPGGAAGSSADATGPASIEGSGWHLVAYVYTGASGVKNNGALYVDGVLVANNKVSTPAGSSYDVWIGGAPDYGSGRLLAGSVAHAAVFARALSAAQVLALYNAASIALPVTLDLSPADSGGNLTLTWTGGLLLEAPALTGPWTTNDAASPFTVEPTNSQMFYRVLAQ